MSVSRLHFNPVYGNPFAPWSEDDVFPFVDLWDLNLAGYRELRDEEGVEEWLESLLGSYWPLLAPAAGLGDHGAPRFDLAMTQSVSFGKIVT